MSVSSSRYPLIRISKTGEMRVKNKVSNAILKENAYEERALNTRLHTLSQIQNRQDKYLSYRQLEFATRQVSDEKPRPRTLPSLDNTGETGILPQVITGPQRSAVQSATGQNKSNSGLPSNKARGKWEKAITLVRVAVQNRAPKELTSQTERKISRQNCPEGISCGSTGLPLPPINTNTSAQKDDVQAHRRKPSLRKQPSLPEMLKASREKTLGCLEDPRFMKLEQCLSTTKSAPIDQERRRRTSRTC